jgi:nitrate/nitrite transport system ATP-binding protein
VVSGPSISRGVIFQNHSLLPWKTALANVAFSVRARWPQWSRDQVRAHSLRYLHMVGLKGGAEHRRPAQLSGGMRQRVGIARAFAIQPEVLLMDEPFGALDAITRADLQNTFRRLRDALGITALLVTHDIQEALLLADRIAVVREGRLEQIAAASELPRSPATDYVRELLRRARVIQ